MIFKNVMSFKSKMNKIAREKNITAQQVQQNYLIEAFLEKLAKSKYRNNFILKGGYLIGAIVGLDQRATMDLDTTIKGLELTLEKLDTITKEIIAIPTKESFVFTLNKISEIRETEDYLGYKLKLHADFDLIHEYISIDVTSGDAITPREIEFSVSRLLTGDKLELFTYTIETILAEKIETILSRGVSSTRPRDIYDVYIFCKLRWKDIDFQMLSCALKNTMIKRGSNFKISEYLIILSEIKGSETQNKLWIKYQHQYSYASDIAFNDAVDSVDLIMKNIII